MFVSKIWVGRKESIIFLHASPVPAHSPPKHCRLSPLSVNNSRFDYIPSIYIQGCQLLLSLWEEMIKATQGLYLQAAEFQQVT